MLTDRCNTTYSALAELGEFGGAWRVVQCRCGTTWLDRCALRASDGSSKCLYFPHAKGGLSSGQSSFRRQQRSAYARLTRVLGASGRLPVGDLAKHGKPSLAQGTVREGLAFDLFREAGCRRPPCVPVAWGIWESTKRAAPFSRGALPMALRRRRSTRSLARRDVDCPHRLPGARLINRRHTDFPAA
jgi:hypothetical protein